MKPLFVAQDLSVAESNSEENQGKLKYFVSAFSAAALWGFMSIPLRLIKAWPAEDILYYRILSSVVLIWIFILIFRKKQLHADLKYLKTLGPTEKKRLFWLSLIASFLIMGNWFTYIYAVNNISVQSAAFAYMVCPLITTVAAYFILKESLSTLKKIGLIVALISVLMLLQGSWIEVLWSISVALLYALYLVVQRVIKHVDKLNLLAVQISICSLFILPLLLVQGHAVPVSLTFWTNIIIIAVVFTIIPLYLSMFALNGISSSTTGILIYINPIIAFLVAIFYFHEEVDAVKLIAYGILLIAVVLFNWEFLQQINKAGQNKS